MRSWICTLVKAREITYSLLHHIYFSSEMFLIRPEVLLLSGSQPNSVQVSRALALLGVFYSNSGFQWLRKLHQFIYRPLSL